jgi:hypothetical protein
MATLEEAIALIKQLSSEDLESLKLVVLGGSNRKIDSLETFTKENRFANGMGYLHPLRLGRK